MIQLTTWKKITGCTCLQMSKWQFVYASFSKMAAPRQLASNTTAAVRKHDDEERNAREVKEEGKKKHLTFSIPLAPFKTEFLGKKTS